MLGIVIVTVATLFAELGSSISKWTIRSSERRIFPIAFLGNLSGTLACLAIAFLVPPNLFGSGVPGGFVFSLASLPFFLPRVVVETALVHLGLLAVARAERSTYGFLRTLTLPALFVIDLMLGYKITPIATLGMALIVGGLLLLWLKHGVGTRGRYLVLLVAFLGVINISLYKYDITHFNSAGAEQGLAGLCIVVYTLIMSLINRENPFVLAREPRYLVQCFTGIADYALLGFAYLFAPASVIASANRALSVLWSILSGRAYFSEKHLLLKVLCFVIVVGGVVLLTL